MTALQRLIARFSEWLASMARAHAGGAQEAGQAARARLEAYRELACELNVVRGELQAVPAEDRSVQAALCLAAAGVVRALADTFGLLTIAAPARTAGIRVAGRHGRRVVRRSERRARLAAGLYHELFQLLEQARIEMAHPMQPHPLDPHELVSDAFLAEPLDSLQAACQRLEETFELDLRLGGEERGNLPRLRARLRARSSVAVALAADYSRSPASVTAEERLWGAELHRGIFRLWILIAQELVRPGVTGSLARDEGEPDPVDAFLMTDPVARARYEREGRLQDLERDIRYEVMRGRPWQPADLEYLQAVQELESQGVLHRMASFWNISPHPPVFKALSSGRMRVGGRSYRFRRGQDIVWACPMLRDLAGLEGPVLVDNFDSKRVTLLCGAMSNAMLGRGFKPVRGPAERSA